MGFATPDPQGNLEILPQVDRMFGHAGILLQLRLRKEGFVNRKYTFRIFVGGRDVHSVVFENFKELEAQGGDVAFHLVDVVLRNFR